MTDHEPDGALAAARAPEEPPLQAEEAGYASDGTFFVTHVPVAPPRAAVVICSPVHAEFMRNYRREVLLARRLAARGLVVRRFHYRGTGNSDDMAEPFTLDTMTTDARAAVSDVVDRYGVPCRALVGTRVAALAAARASADAADTHLVLWEPVLDPAKYFKDVFRSLLMRNLKEGQRGAASTKAFVEDLRGGKVVDVLGYPITPELHGSVVAGVLDDIPPRRRPITIMEMSPGPEPRAEMVSAATTLRERGHDVHLAVAGEREAWWFAGGGVAPAERVSLTEGVLAVTEERIVASAAVTVSADQHKGRR